ncbi:MAG: recombination mediator RecR [Candidatus Omnitrophica bacterium]|nr:recombination mediator RecR [Candidatus Omnitrophota bacterium]MDD5671277.1 recombination mediator RecR [Candidatus Omnitrophota bacterium]
MKGYSEWMSRLIQALSKLPGIGRRSAERIVFHLLKAPGDEVTELARLLQMVKEKTLFCQICHNFSDESVCHICSDPGRDKGMICVVEDPKDVVAIEKTGNYVGVYHVLLGFLSAIEGVGPEELQIADLVERVKNGNVREVILATNPSTEGETTALYLTRILKPLKVKVTRLAHGISVGSMLEYTDQATLARALEGRVSA